MLNLRIGGPCPTCGEAQAFHAGLSCEEANKKRLERIRKAMAPALVKLKAHLQSKEKTVGNYVIHIEGTGPHHNGQDYDAEKIAGVAVKSLKDAGHNVEAATFTAGSRQTVEAPKGE